MPKNSILQTVKMIVISKPIVKELYVKIFFHKINWVMRSSNTVMVDLY